MQSDKSSRIAILISSFGDGGVERMMVNLARGFDAAGAAVDFVACTDSGPYLPTLPATVRRIVLEGASIRFELVDYLRKANPAVLISAKLDDDALALWAKRRAGAGTRIYARVGTNLSGHRTVRRFAAFKHWRKTNKLSRLYRQVDGVICVSPGVADDLQAITGLPRERMHVLPNPVVTPELAEQAAEAVDHPWFAPQEPPVILGAGRLSAAKNFPLLLRAFTRVRALRACRLMIIGEGRKRPELEALARQLNIHADFTLPGFVHNAYAYMAKSALFVLSSKVEGSPNVLIEALACGTPVVATDCPSGPREILAGGRFGALVPVADEAALANAIEAALDAPLSASELQAAASGYTLKNSAQAYLGALGVQLGPRAPTGTPR